MQEVQQSIHIGYTIAHIQDYHARGIPDTWLTVFTFINTTSVGHATSAFRCGRTMSETRLDFEWRRDTPEAMLYVVYVVFKVVICFNYFCHSQCTKFTCDDIHYEDVESRNCRSCLTECCFPCIKWIVYNCWKCSAKLNHVLVSILFGAPLGAVERLKDEYKKHETADRDEEREEHNGMTADEENKSVFW